VFLLGKGIANEIPDNPVLGVMPRGQSSFRENVRRPYSNRPAMMDERKQALTSLEICLISAVVISIFLLPFITYLLS
jgi:hypothetical protein